MPRHIRKSLVWSLWFVTWVGLLTGLFDSTFYEYVTLFCIAHTMFVLYLVGFRVAAFPAQVRIAFTIGVAVGSYVPYLESLLYLKMAGLVANLILGYCPMARTVYLLPWNREESLSMDLVRRVIFSAPVAGKFMPQSPNIEAMQSGAF